MLNLDILLEKANEIHYIQSAEMEVIRQWRKDPQAWTDQRA